MAYIITQHHGKYGENLAQGSFVNYNEAMAKMRHLTRAYDDTDFEFKLFNRDTNDLIWHTKRGVTVSAAWLD